MGTRAEALASAKWKAKQHAAEVDALTVDQWSACFARAWRKLWAVHPEAFHVDGELVGLLPDVPTLNGDTLPIVAEWLDVLGSGIAADAVAAITADTPERSRALSDQVARLEVAFINGMA